MKASLRLRGIVLTGIDYDTESRDARGYHALHGTTCTQIVNLQKPNKVWGFRRPISMLARAAKPNGARGSLESRITNMRGQHSCTSVPYVNRVAQWVYKGRLPLTNF